jgi:predicted ATPase
LRPDNAGAKENLSIAYQIKNKNYSFSSLPFGELEKNIIGTCTENLKSTIPLGKGFQYLAAERQGPASSYPNHEREDAQSIGKRGEYTAFLLEKYAREIVQNKAVCLPEGKVNQLQPQTAAWLNRISAGASVKGQALPGGKHTALRFAYRTADGLENERSPFNVGHGLTSTLPLIVATLRAKPGDILMIENPETHLHDSSQAELMQLFLRAAASGVQIFIETHSDHVVKSILAQGKEMEQKENCEALLKSEDVVTFFFSINPDTRLGEVVQIRSEKWTQVYTPEGYFEQNKKNRKIIKGF